MVIKSSLPVAIETLRQKALACSRKVIYYQIEGFRQNQLFFNNQKNFYASKSGHNRQQKVGSDITNGNEIIKFWKKLRGNNEPHNVTATWISDVSESLTDMILQRDIVVTESVVGKAVKAGKQQDLMVCIIFGLNI